MTTKNSTNVRLAGLRAASVLAPTLVAVWLDRIFMTPRRWPTPAHETDWLAEGQPFRVQSARHQIAAWSWGSGPAVLLAHGWEGRGSQLGAFVQPLLAAGLRVVAFDAPGHGGSTGRRSSFPEMAATLAAVARQSGEVRAVVAHSAGAAATTIALRDGLKIERLVYLSPPSDPGRFLYALTESLGLRPSVAQRTQRRIERRIGARWDDLRPTRIAPAMTTPLLIIHDTEDREVSWSQAQELAKAWPDARMITTHGLGHRRILRDEQVVAAATRFLTDPAPPTDAPPPKLVGRVP